MRRLLIIAIVLSLATVLQAQHTRRPAKPAATAQKATDAEDREAIQQLHSKDISASLSFDVEALEALWDDKIVSLPPGDAPVVGKDANRALLDKQKDQIANIEIMGYTQDWREVQMAGDYAFEWGTIQGRTRGANGNETEYTYKALRVLKKQPDGAWKIYRTMWNAAPGTQPGAPAPAH